jgi:ferredoxin--NADP+ reductase
VVGSGRFVGWVNGHPDHAGAAPAAPCSVVVIGNGNVALDVARLLAKAPGEFEGSDLGAFVQGVPTEIHIVGRRGPDEAKFTDHELEELAGLQRARPIVADPSVLTSDTARATLLRSFQDLPAKPVSMRFHFGLTPDAMLGEGRVEAVRFLNAAGEARLLAADLVVTCVGYQARACCAEAPTDGLFANDGGHVRDGLYAVGWAKRGPSGTIPTNRIEAQAVAQRIAATLPDGGKPGGAGLRALLDGQARRWVDYDGWRRIEAHEAASADPGRCRRKVTAIDEMLAAAGGS